jgi:cobalt-precorrin 5A hydrolase
MKVAALTLTKGGAARAREVRECLGDHDVDVFVASRFKDAGVKELSLPLSDFVARVFKEYDALVFVMALGIVVRSISGLPKDKRTDPAVVCVDEAGKYSISVLSGHLGGANDLAEGIAKGLGAVPVITTATDVLGLPSVEGIAKENGWKVGEGDLTAVNSAIVNGDRVGIFSDYGDRVQGAGDILVFQIDELSKTDVEAAIIITDRILEGVELAHIFLRPPILTAGVGARRGVSRDRVLEAIKAAFALASLSLESLAGVATAEFKAEEPGIAEAAEALGVPLYSIPKEDIIKVEESFKTSEFVKEKTGVGAVAEPCAVLAREGSRLVAKKQKFDGVTVAIGRIG